VTSAAYGHRVARNLALAFLEVEGQDGDLEVDVVGTRRPCRVIPSPAFDPESLRVRG
jgi:dimethylglycine dehydrogenase